MKFECEDVKVYIGEIEEDEEAEGPNPRPQVTDLREWDRKLLSRYKPKYHSYIKQCQFCAYGPCDLSAGRRGACGITLEKQMAREALFLTITGAAAHTAHARHGLHTLIEKFGKHKKLDVVDNSEVQAPWTNLVTGKNPKTLGDLNKALNYAQEQLTHLLSSLHMGQESSDSDFNSKALHAGMIDHLGMEIADISQIAALGFPKGDPKPELVDIGFGTVDHKKPVVLCIGHNVSTGTEIIDYAAENDHDIEVAGICCTALDLARYNIKTKIVGQLSYQLPFVRSGIADVIVLDEQCIRVDTIENAQKQGIPVITTSDKSAGNLPDLSKKDPDDVVKKLVSRELVGCYMPDLEKAGEIAVKTAMSVHKEEKPKEDYLKEIEKCTGCGLCSNACPVGNDTRSMIRTIKNRLNQKHATLDEVEKTKDEIIELLNEHACSPTELSEKFGISRQYVYKILTSLQGIHKKKKGKDVYYSFSEDAINQPKPRGKPPEGRVLSDEELMESLGRCVFCGKCESWCPQKIPIISTFSEVYKEKFISDKARISPGRGAIQDVEIREVGAPLVFGDIPGIIAPVGCSFWPNGGKELGEIIEEFLKRNYIVTASGCSAMALATDYSGTHNLYEKYGGEFAAGNLVNVGSCVANAHITGAAIKVANIFAKRPIGANFEEIADYVLNRIGAVGLVWGTMSQKAVSIGSGCMRLGIPVIWGPSGKKYRKELISDDDTDWSVYDTRGSGSYDVGPVPEHLSYVADKKEEVMVLIPKLCMRANDGIRGRQKKLAHYISLYENYYGEMPPDLHRFVRNEKEIPITLKDKVMELLQEQEWEPTEKIPDPTLLERLSKGVG